MIGIAVLGAGRIGSIHAHNVAANSNARLLVVADPVAAAAQGLAGPLEADAITDCMAAIDRDDVSAVVVATPTHTHIGLMLHAVRQGKAVLCEKPIDLDVEKSSAAVAEVQAANGKVMLAFNRRFEATFAAMKSAILAGDIGEVRQIVITSRDPGLAPEEYLRTSGGIFRDMTIHDLDMARWLLGEEPVRIWASGSRLIDGALMQRHGDYDTAMVVMQTVSGKQCHINNCRHSVYGYDQRVEVFGSGGMLLQDNLRPTTLRRWNGRSTDAREPLLNFFLERYQQAYKAELDAFIAALAGNSPMPITVQDGLKALQLAESALESARTGHSVPAYAL